MSPQLSLILQYIAIALAVAVSAWVVFRKQAPNAARSLRIALALPLLPPAAPLAVPESPPDPALADPLSPPCPPDPASPRRPAD